MSLIFTLKKLGLSEKEAAVYLAGLELGPASVKALSIKSKVKRTTIYPVLDDLKEKGLFSESIKKKKHLYIAGHPNQLKVLVNDQQLLLEEKFQQLLMMTNADSGKPAIQYFDTIEGIHKMYEDSLAGVKKETIGISNDGVVEGLGEDWLKKYVSKRKRAGVRSRSISVDSYLAREWQKNDGKDVRETRFVSKENDLPVNIEVVGDRVLISSPQGEVFGMVIESKRVAKAMETVLGIVWEALE